MPELPEVETVVRTLRPHLVGRKLLGVHAGPQRLRKPWKSSWNKNIVGHSILEVNRRGKWILLELSHAEYRLVVHLGMTGRLLIQPNQKIKEIHTHLTFKLDNEQQLRYQDPRRFGSVTLEHTQNQFRFPQEAALGPEPFDLTTAYLKNCLAGSSRCLKAILLDQSVIAGVGNIYADEALHRAGLDPRRLGMSLLKVEIQRLRTSIVAVLRKAIHANGSTIASFYFGNDESGEFQNEFCVYGRTGQSCNQCHATIQRLRLAGRSTHYCPVCQT